MMYCQHYDPQPGSLLDPNRCWCKKGHDTEKVQAAAKAAGVAPKWWKPCIDGHELDDAAKFCPDWIRRTRQEGEERADELEASMNRMRVVMPVVSQWRTWSKKNRVAKQEVIECPACKGRLHLSQAAYNGHVWGKCETEGCVSWME